MGVRADAPPSPQGCVRVDANLVVVAGLEREKKFTIYNFRFSVFNPQNPKIPKIPQLPELPELPELRGLRERSREKKKVFLA
jgi:hypothetical protein